MATTAANSRKAASGSRLLSISLLGVAALQALSPVFVSPAIQTARRRSSSSLQALSLDELEVGQKHKGTVMNTAPFGAFVDFGAESQGLVHISCLQDGFVDDVSAVVQSGDEVDVWVKSVDTFSGKVGLTMVESKLGGGGGGGGRPRADLTVFQDVPYGEKIKGTVQRIQNFGAFVEVEVSGQVAQGLVHVSQMSDDFVDDPWSVVSEGQEVEVTIKDVDVGAGKMSLSMKSDSGSGGGGAPADLTVFQDLPSGEKIKGTVKSIQNFGAFVEVEAEGQVAQGLVHVSEMSDDYVDDPFSVVSEGQEVEVTIKDVDVGAGKMSLSMKSGSEDEEE
jgi:ribosomal protein S1